MSFASDDKCRGRTGGSEVYGWSPPRRSTTASAALGLIAMVLVLLNTPTAGTAAAPRAAGALTRPIPHTIKPFRSVGGIKLGFTIAQVKHRFGRPDHRFVAAHRRLAKYDYDDENFEVGFGGVPLRVVWVATYRRRDRTPQGLRIDSSTVARARRVYPHGLHCVGAGTRPPTPSCTVYDHGDRSRPHMTFVFSELGHRLGDIELSVPTSRIHQITGTRR